MNAVNSNQTDNLKQLLTKENVNACDEEGRSLLMLASIKGNKEACEVLLKEGADVDKKDREGQTALYAAASRGHVEVCDLLLANNAHVDEKNNSGVTPLCIAAQEGHLLVCTLLLDNNAYVNAQTHSGVTALYIASQFGYVDVCTLLLERNAQVNQAKNDGLTPLMAASFFGHVEVCDCLLQKNAAINYKGKSGETALICAYYQKKKNVFNLLFQHGANIHDVGNDEKSILDTINDSINQNDERFNDANKEVEKAKKNLPMSETEKIIDTNRESLKKTEESKVRFHQLKHSSLKKEKAKNNIEVQGGFSKQETNKRTTRSSCLKTRKALTTKSKYGVRSNRKSNVVYNQN